MVSKMTSKRKTFILSLPPVLAFSSCAFALSSILKKDAGMNIINGKCNYSNDNPAAILAILTAVLMIVQIVMTTIALYLCIKETPTVTTDSIATDKKIIIFLVFYWMISSCGAAFYIVGAKAGNQWQNHLWVGDKKSTIFFVEDTCKDKAFMALIWGFVPILLSWSLNCIYFVAFRHSLFDGNNARVGFV